MSGIVERREVGKCANCGIEPCDDAYVYLINAEGGYGLPEYWVCEPCLIAAPEGSIIAEKRNTIYRKYLRPTKSEMN